MHDPDKLARMTAKQVIDKKAPILRQALIDAAMDPKEAKKKVAELKKKARQRIAPWEQSPRRSGVEECETE